MHSERLQISGERRYELASRGARLGAALIDALIGLAVSIPLCMWLGVFETVKRGQALSTATLITVSFLGFLAFLVIHGQFLYQSGQTVGKKLIGLQIVGLDDQVPPLINLIVLRYLPISVAALLPFGNLLVIADALAIFRSDRRCLHDLIAGTRVIDLS